MNWSTQANTHDDGDTTSRGGRETARSGVPSPFETDYRPFEGYLGERDGRPVDPDASYDNDATGPIPMELEIPFVAERIDGPYDVDWFSVELVAGRTYDFHVRGEATGDGTLEDPAFGGFWFDPDGDDQGMQYMGGFQSLDEGYGTNAALTFTPTATGTYYFAAFAENWAVQSATGSYSVEVNDSTDDVAAGRFTEETLALEQSVDGPSRVGGVGCLGTDGDGDWFPFEVPEGRAGIFEHYSEPTVLVDMTEDGDTRVFFNETDGIPASQSNAPGPACEREGIPDFLLPYVQLQVEPADSDAM